MTTFNYVGAATMATSLLWTLGTRVNSNLIEGISRNNDLYKKNLQFWIANPDMVEATSYIRKIVNLLKVDDVNKYYVEATVNGDNITWNQKGNLFDNINTDKYKDRDSIRKIFSYVSQLEFKLNLIKELLDDTDTFNEKKIEEALKFAYQVKIQTYYILDNERWNEEQKNANLIDNIQALKKKYPNIVQDTDDTENAKKKINNFFEEKKDKEIQKKFDDLFSDIKLDLKSNTSQEIIDRTFNIRKKTEYIKSQLSTYSAINYYSTNFRNGILPYENPANVTNSKLDFVTTSANYYTHDSESLKITQSQQLDFLAYGTQSLSGLAALKTDNPIYLLLNLVPLTILTCDISRNYINLGKGI
jgi:hypothetical protein